MRKNRMKHGGERQRTVIARQKAAVFIETPFQESVSNGNSIGAYKKTGKQQHKLPFAGLASIITGRLCGLGAVYHYDKQMNNTCLPASSMRT